VQFWKENFLSENFLSGEVWGLQFVAAGWYQAVQTRTLTPQSLLKLARCTCKSRCGTPRCGCRRQHLKCSAVCSECRGVYENVTPLDDITDKEDDDFEL